MVAVALGYAAVRDKASGHVSAGLVFLCVDPARRPEARPPTRGSAHASTFLLPSPLRFSVQRRHIKCYPALHLSQLSAVISPCQRAS